MATLQDGVDILHQGIQDASKERLSNVRDDTDTLSCPSLEDPAATQTDTVSQGSNTYREFLPIRSNSPSIPDYAGPTSSFFSLGVAKMILEQDRPSIPEELDPELAGSVTTTNEQGRTQMEGCLSRDMGSSDLGSLHEIDLNEAFRLINLYDDIIGTLLPIVDIETIKTQAEMLWANIIYELNPNESSFGIRECDATPLKMVIAIALLAEDGGYNHVATDLRDSVLPNVLSHAVLGKFSVRGQQIILLNVRADCDSEDFSIRL